MTIEDEMVGWHQRLNGRESEQALGAGEGQGHRGRCSAWGHKEWDTTERVSSGSSRARQQLSSFHWRLLATAFGVTSPANEKLEHACRHVSSRIHANVYVHFLL